MSLKFIDILSSGIDFKVGTESVLLQGDQGPGKSWNLKNVLEYPGFLKSFKKCPGLSWKFHLLLFSRYFIMIGF